MPRDSYVRRRGAPFDQPKPPASEIHEVMHFREMTLKHLRDIWTVHGFDKKWVSVDIPARSGVRFVRG